MDTAPSGVTTRRARRLAAPGPARYPARFLDGGDMARIRAAVLGATGVAGQQFIVALDGHPDFELTRLGASQRSAGKSYAEAIRDAGHTRWYCREALPPSVAALPVEDAATMPTEGVDVVFAAVESDAART